MNKKSTTKQSKTNFILSLLVGLLTIHSALMTYLVFAMQAANESSDQDLASQIFELRINKAYKE